MDFNVREVIQPYIKKAIMNHETYKCLLAMVQRKIHRVAADKKTRLDWIVPNILLGRPLYDVDHAARYIAKKLKRGNFDVAVDRVGTGRNDVELSLCIDWTKQARKEVDKAVKSKLRSNALKSRAHKQATASRETPNRESSDIRQSLIERTDRLLSRHSRSK